MPQPFVSQLGYLWIVAPLLVVTMVVMWRLERNARRPGAGGAPRGRAGRRRHGDQSHLLQDPGLHDGRDPGRCGRRRQRALPEHLERPPGDVRRERQPPRLRPHRRLAHLPGARRGRPAPHCTARGPPRRGRHRRAPGLARALPEGRAPHHLRHAHRRRQRVLSSRTDHAGAPAGAAARPRSTRPVGPGRSRRRAAAARGLRGTPAPRGNGQRAPPRGAPCVLPLRRTDRRQRRVLRGAARRDLRDHRPERCRQDHALQRHHRHGPAGRRAGRLPGR